MPEVDALTAARRARQRRRKELQRHGQAVLRRVLGVALLSAAALLYGASSNYTSHKDKEFGSGAGMLWGWCGKLRARSWASTWPTAPGAPESFSQRFRRARRHPGVGCARHST